MKTQTFIFIGRSGSGKGTQINLLKKYITELNPKINTYSFVMGDTLRAFGKNKGYVQNIIQNMISKGILVPNLVSNSLFVSEILNNLKSDQHLFIDGLPRSILQVDTVIDILKFYERENPIIINVEVGKEEVEKRMLLRSRPDDKKEAIIEKLEYYEKNVVPAIELLKEKSGFKYLEINGERSINEIHLDIVNQLKNII